MNFLFVGLGSIGQRHLRILKKLTQNLNFQLQQKETN